jgi:transcriptional regulator with XRE-family HTH domain
MNKAKLQKIVGARIRQIRLEKNMTQEELAVSVGKQRPAIQRIEGGHINPSIYTLREVAAGLGIKLEELVMGLDN